VGTAKGLQIINMLRSIGTAWRGTFTP